MKPEKLVINHHRVVLHNLTSLFGSGLTTDLPSLNWSEKKMHKFSFAHSHAHVPLWSMMMFSADHYSWCFNPRLPWNVWSNAFIHPQLPHCVSPPEYHRKVSSSIKTFFIKYEGFYSLETHEVTLFCWSPFSSWLSNDADSNRLQFFAYAASYFLMSTCAHALLSLWQHLFFLL